MEIKPLDLILFKADKNTALGASMIFAGQWVGHAGCAYKNLGNNSIKIIEAVQELSFNDYLITNPNICVRRFNESIYETLANRCIEDYYLKNVSKKTTKYPYWDLVDSGLNVIMKVLTFGKWSKHNLLKDESGMICSATYCEILHKYFNKEIFHEIKVISPQDLYESSLFTTIKDFNK